MRSSGARWPTWWRTSVTADAIFARDLDAGRRRTDRLFFWLLLGQWVFAIGLALWLSPYSWAGRSRQLHVHLQLAILLGGAINAAAGRA